MTWPLSQDYNEAIQSPAGNFADPDLRRGEAVCNALGLPMPYSGNFADVYQVRCPDGSRWAVKCFTREVPGLRERYAEISRHLRYMKLPFTVDFTYLEQGIRVAGAWYPALKMQWVEGLTLNQFVGKNADNPALLQALLHSWSRMAQYLRAAEVGHCDLQHGNVLLVPGASANSVALKLIDYDGMWVPALARKKSGEVGHPCYQHPQRLREGSYSIDVDRFPLLLIATALRALKVKGKALWDKYDNGDNLLFKEADLLAPLKSYLFLDLTKTGDDLVGRMMDILVKALRGSLETVPLLEQVMPEAPAGSSTLHPAPRESRPAAQPVPSPQPARVRTDPRPGEAPWHSEAPSRSAASPAKRERRRKRGGVSLTKWLAAGAASAGVLAAVGIAWWALGQTPTPPAPARPNDGVAWNDSNPSTPDQTAPKDKPKDPPPGDTPMSEPPVKPAADRVSAATALGRLGPAAGPEDVAQLLTFLHDDSAEVREAALRALGKIGNPPAHEAVSGIVKAARSETDGAVRKTALEVLLQLVGADDKAEAPAVAPLLGDKDPETRYQAAFVLGIMGGPEALKGLPVLREALRSDDSHTQESAAVALAGLGKEAAPAVEDLGAALAEAKEPAVRENAAVSLANIGPPAAKALPQILLALQDAGDAKYGRVRVRAAEALQAIHMPGVEPAIPAALKIIKSDPDPLVRQRCLWSLFDIRKLDQYGITPVLTEALNETDPNSAPVRYDAARLLALCLRDKAPDKVPDVLLDMLHNRSLKTLGVDMGGDARFFAAQALACLGRRANRPDIVKALEDATHDDDAKLQASATEALEHIPRLPPPPPASSDADWLKAVAALPVDLQVMAVTDELKRRNSEFDGDVQPKVENDVVTGLQFCTDNVTDIAPVRALPGLKSLSCGGSGEGKGRLSDLSPLKEVRLTELDCSCTPVSDLSPLKEMKLTFLNCSFNQVSDLSPLKGLPLTDLDCHGTKASDLSPLKETALKNLRCDFKPERDAEILRSMRTLEQINGKPAKDFWNDVDAAAANKKPPVTKPPAEDDAIRAKLDKAKADFDAAVEKYQQKVHDSLDKAEADARAAGKKDQVDQIKAEREAFDNNGGDLPKSVSRAKEYKQDLDEARRTLDEAYADAVAAFTRAKMDDKAAATVEERKQFQEEHPTDAFRAGSVWKGKAVQTWLGHPDRAVTDFSLTVKERDDKTFKATVVERGNTYDVSGTIKRGGVVSWLAKDSQVIQGTLGADFAGKFLGTTMVLQSEWTGSYKNAPTPTVLAVELQLEKK